MARFPNPQITWKGTNGVNFWPGRAGQKAVAICNHIQEGNRNGTWSVFSNPTQEVSAHFSVNTDGSIWQFVDLKDTAWANGIVEAPDKSLNWLLMAIRDGVNPNRLTVSLEWEGYSGRPIPNVQYKAGLALHLWLLETLGIVPDRNHIIGHYQITAYQRAGCPGPAFPWNELMQDIQNAFITPQTAPEPAQSGPDNPINGYWVIEPVRAFYDANRGVGLPVGGMFTLPYKSPITGGDILAQNFERNRVEAHKRPDGTFALMLGLTNRERLELLSELGRPQE